jgi:hypothetical protein
MKHSLRTWMITSGEDWLPIVRGSVMRSNGGLDVKKNDSVSVRNSTASEKICVDFCPLLLNWPDGIRSK